MSDGKPGNRPPPQPLEYAPPQPEPISAFPYLLLLIALQPLLFMCAMPSRAPASHQVILLASYAAGACACSTLLYLRWMMLIAFLLLLLHLAILGMVAGEIIDVM